MDNVFGIFPWVLRAPVPELGKDKQRVSEIVMAEHAVWKPRPGQYSFKLASTDDWFRALYDQFAEACTRTFEPMTLHAKSKRDVWAYVQRDGEGSPVWHEHLMTSTINGVYYLSAPEGCGEIWFRHRDTIHKHAPAEGYLYMFPRWLLHKPMPQATSEPRISLNIEMVTVECPITREGWRW